MDSLSCILWITLSWATLHLIFYLLLATHNKLPPGPLPLPIVGNPSQLCSRPHKSLAELAKLHGPVMCRLLWRKKLEDLVSYVKLRSEAGEAVEIGHVAFNTTLNLLSRTFFSVDLVDPNSSLSREFKEVFWQIMSEAAFSPVLKCVDPQRIWRRMGGNMIDLFECMISERLAEKQGRLDVENDALDALLNISNTEDIEISDIPHMLLELFVAGTETTSSTTEWAMKELLCNPNKMNKAREELERVVGKGVPVKEEDLPNLPYLEALITESFRNDGPVSLIARRAESDVELGGFIVPKNSQILINLWAIGKDPSTWNNPDSFECSVFLLLTFRLVWVSRQPKYSGPRRGPLVH